MKISLLHIFRQARVGNRSWGQTNTCTDLAFCFPHVFESALLGQSEMGPRKISEDQEECNSYSSYQTCSKLKNVNLL